MPHAEEPMAAPLRAGDGEGHSGRARIGCAVPRESVIDYSHPFDRPCHSRVNTAPDFRTSGSYAPRVDEIFDSVCSSEPGVPDRSAVNFSAEPFVIRSSSPTVFRLRSPNAPA